MPADDSQGGNWYYGDIVYCMFPDGRPRVGVVVAEPDRKEWIMSIQLYVDGQPLAWRTSVRASWCELIGNINVL